MLGQQRVEGKSNEKTAIPELLEGLELKGAVVSIDAMACHSTISEKIAAGGGDYLLALKKNNRGLYEQVSEHMLRRMGQLPRHEWVGFGSGRIERRVCYVCQELTLLDGLDGWPAISRVVMVVAGREKQAAHRADPLLPEQPGGWPADLQPAGAQPLGHRKQPPLDAGRLFR